MSTRHENLHLLDEEIEQLFSQIDELEFTEIKEVTALPETAATSGSAISQGCSTCGSSSTCSSST